MVLNLGALGTRGTPLWKALRSKRFIVVGGKGGTGKSTTASALAVSLAREESKEVLVVSTDPAHSLGDVLCAEIGPRIREVRIGDVRIKALEFSPRQLFSLKEEELRKVCGELGIDLDPDALCVALDALTMPVEYVEGMMFMSLLDSLSSASDYDVVVFDTAPTGHTLKMLELPDVMNSFLMKLFRLQLRIASFFSRLKRLFGMAGEDMHGTVLRALNSAIELAKRCRKILTDEKLTEFVIVCIPTELSLLESTRLAGHLEALSVPNRYVVVNMVRTHPGTSCSFCRALSRLHMRVLREILQAFSDKFVACVPFFDFEPRGEMLFRFSEHLKVLPARELMVS